MRRPLLSPLTVCLGALSLGLASSPAHAVRISAATGPVVSMWGTNTMGLPPKLLLFDPGTAAFTGATSLAAPPLLGISTDTYPSFGFGTPLTAVQMSGDAISSITQPTTGSYDISLTLTNFNLSSISLPANEYVYLNLWETFTGLPSLSTANWSGGASISGTACRTSLNDALYIEPIATVFDPGASTWIPASLFFGGTPACGAITASAAVSPLSAYISGGTLMVGFEVILGLNNADVTGGDVITLPTSLEMNLRYEPVPGPLPMAGGLTAWSFSRRLRRRIRSLR